MFLITYLLINLIILNYNIFDSEINSIFFNLVLGVALLILNINHTENIKQKSGAILIEVKPNFYAKWIEILITIGIFSGFIIFLGYSKIPQSQLLTIFVLTYQVIYSLYLIFFTKKLFNENGLLINDRFLKWDIIESYEWHEKQFQIRGNQSNLLIKQKTKLFGREFNLNIDYSQRTEIESLLIQKVATVGCETK